MLFLCWKCGILTKGETTLLSFEWHSNKRIVASIRDVFISFVNSVFSCVLLLIFYRLDLTHQLTILFSDLSSTCLLGVYWVYKLLWHSFTIFTVRVLVRGKTRHSHWFNSGHNNIFTCGTLSAVLWCILEAVFLSFNVPISKVKPVAFLFFQTKFSLSVLPTDYVDIIKSQWNETFKNNSDGISWELVVPYCARENKEKTYRFFILCIYIYKNIDAVLSMQRE